MARGLVCIIYYPRKRHSEKSKVVEGGQRSDTAASGLTTALRKRPAMTRPTSSYTSRENRAEDKRQETAAAVVRKFTITVVNLELKGPAKMFELVIEFELKKQIKMFYL